MKTYTYISLALGALLLAACSGGTLLRTEGGVESGGISGTYRVIVYGGLHARDTERMVILDREGDEYRIDIRAPKFMYAVNEGMSAADALTLAGWHMRRAKPYLGRSLMRIVGSGGETIGYDARPGEATSLFGRAVPLRVSYVLGEGGRVTAHVSEDQGRRATHPGRGE